MKYRIKEICKEKSITLIQLAEKIGIARESLSRIASGANTTTETLVRIAGVLGVSIQELFATSGGDFYGLIVYNGVNYKIDSYQALKELCDLVESKQK